MISLENLWIFLKDFFRSMIYNMGNCTGYIQLSVDLECNMNQLKAQDFHILIVEDDKEIRDGIEIYLKNQGY